MPNSIIKENLNVANNLTVTGTIYIVENEKALEQIENLDSFTYISGDYDNLEINGDLAVCEYCCNINVSGELRSIGNVILN